MAYRRTGRGNEYAASDLEGWDPRRFDYENKDFNSYKRGPGSSMYFKKARARPNEKGVTLFVTGIPIEIEDEGLRNLFSRAGAVMSATKKQPKIPGSSDTYGFVTMATISDAERAIRELNQFKIGQCFMRVKVSMSKEELREKDLQRRNNSNYGNIEGFDEDYSDSEDTRFKTDVTPQAAVDDRPKSSAVSQFMAKGRGHVLGMALSETFRESQQPSRQVMTKSMNGKPSPNSSAMQSLTVNIDQHRPRKAYSGYESAGELQSMGRHNVQGGYDPGLVTPRGCGGVKHGGGYRDSLLGPYRGPENGQYRDIQPGSYRGQAHGEKGLPGGNRDSLLGPYKGPEYGGHPAPGSYRGHVQDERDLPGPYRGHPPDERKASQNSLLLQPAPQASPGYNSRSSRQTDDAEPVETVLKQECSVCSKLGSQRCSRCKQPYCSQKCQVADWGTHKLVCTTIKKELDESKAFNELFDTTVGDELIPKVKYLMEKAIGEPIEITKKPQTSPQPGPSPRSRLNTTDSPQSRAPSEKGSTHSNDRRQEQRGDTTQSRGDNRRDKQPITNGCFNCGETTHMRKDCTNKSSCYNCGSPSHRRIDCPKPQGYRENKNEAVKNKMTSTQPKSMPQQKSNFTPTAESTPKNEARVKAKTVSPPPPKKTLQSAEMPMNEVIEVFLTEVIDPGSFYLQMNLPRNFECLLNITNTLAEKYGNSTNTTCDVSSVLMGELYAGKFSVDQQWYRVQVTSTGSEKISVLFVDYGNTETTKIDQLRQLDHSLETLPKQAVHCSLNGIVPMGQEWNITATKLQDFIRPNIKYSGVCMSVRNRKMGNLYEIKLTNDEGADVGEALVKAGLAQAVGSTRTPNATIEASNGAISPIVQSKSNSLKVKDIKTAVSQLKVGDEQLFLITDAKSPTEFGVQVIHEDFSIFNQKLQAQYMTSTAAEYRPEVGELVVSRFTGDTDWYRAEVLELKEDGANVLYGDYLNSDLVKFDMMRKAEPFCADVPIQGVHCTLHGVDAPSNGNWPPAVATVLAEIAQNPLRGTVKAVKDNCVSLELATLKGVSVNDIMKELSVFTEPTTKTVTERVNEELPVKEDVKPVVIRQGELPMDGSSAIVAVTAVTAVDKVYVQIQDRECLEKLCHLQTDLTKTCVEGTGFKPNEGDTVAAKFTDETWYRGVVLTKVSTDSYSVLFVDYGNTEVVKCEGMAKLDAGHCKLPCMAVRCQLHGSETNAYPDLVSDLQKLLNSQFTAKAVAYNQGTYSIDLNLMDGNSVNELLQLVQGKKPEQANEPEPVIPPGARDSPAALTIEDRALPLDGTLVSSVVMYIESLSCFYVQFTDTAVQQKLALIQQQLNEACEVDKTLCMPEEGEYVAAKYTADGCTMWYRAKVLTICSDKVEVFILDYGNSDWVMIDDVRRLDEAYMSEAAMAVKCKLNGSTGHEARDVEEDFLSVKNMLVNVKAILKQGDKYLVDLILNDAHATSVGAYMKLIPESPRELSLNEESPNSERLKDASPMSQTSLHLDGTSPSGIDTSKVIKSLPTGAMLPRTTDVTIPGLELPIGGTVSGAAFWIESIRSFYIQLADEALQTSFTEMMKEMLTGYENTCSGYEPVKGEIAAAHYNDGEQALWYRAEVRGVSDNKYQVFFLDYGQSDIVELKDFRKLDKKYLTVPKMAIQCSLVGEGTQTTEMLGVFREVLNIEMKIKAIAVSGKKYEVEMMNLDGVSINEKLGLQLQASSALRSPSAASSGSKSPSTEIVDQLPKPMSPAIEPLPKKVRSPPKGERKSFFTQTLTKSRPKGKELRVVITSIVRPNLFHCQEFKDDPETLSELKFLTDTMKLECEHDLPGPGTENLAFEVGELCCARYPVEGGDWYRACILEVFPDNTAKVEYVDFGNQTEVPIAQIRPATEEYTRLPLLAFRCSLHGVVPAGSSWTDEALKEMTKFQDRALHARVINVQNGVYELSIQNENSQELSDILISGGIAKAPEDTDGVSEMERVRRQNEMLQAQLAQMAAQLEALNKK